MKILVVSHAYAEWANHKKLEVLSNISGLEVGLIYPKRWRTWHGEDKQHLTIDNGQLTYKEYTLDTIFTGDGGRYFYNPIQLIVSILKFRPGIIYAEEEPFSFVSCQLSVISWLLRKRFVFFTWENLDLPLGSLRNFIEKITFTVATKAVVGSFGAVERLKKRGFLKPTVVIPQFGVDTTTFRRSLLVKETLSTGSIMTIGFVGRPSTAKGIDVLMRAVSQLPFDYQVLIVTSSKGIPQEFIDLAYSLGISEKVQYKTSIPHAELPKYFNLMDIFVLPSRTTPTWKEQFGRTLLEAMACGVPVIGSSSGAIPEVIDSAGLVFKEEDANDLRDKLSILNDATIRKELANAGGKRILENYTYQILCNNLVNFLSP